MSAPSQPRSERFRGGSSSSDARRAGSSRTLLVLLLGTIPLAAVLYFLFESETTRSLPEERGAPRFEARASDSSDRERPGELIPVPVLERSTEAGSGVSTVLWPLEVELVLREAAYLPHEEGMVNIGSGASAGLRGRIHDRRDRGTRAEVRFVAGTNFGRVLTTDNEGRFGAKNLYPGLSIVEVTGSGIGGARREIRLRQGDETELHISFYRPATVVGRVQDRTGEPIAGAEVKIDGTPVRSTLDGGFSLAGVAAGKVLMEVSHPEFASTQALVWVAAAQVTPPDSLVFTLHRGCSIDVVVKNDVGGPGPIELVVLPGQTGKARPLGSVYREERYPYHGLNPIQVRPGEPRRITGLPARSLRVYAFRPGAKATMRFVNPRPDTSKVLEIQLNPAQAITGRITRDGEPAIGVPVTLEAASRVRATLSHVNEGRRFLESAALPNFSPAYQTARTDAEGKYRFTAWEKESATRYLEAKSADGAAWAGKLVHAGETRVDLSLEDASFGNSMVELEFPGRFQGLPVEVRIDGSPHDRMLLPAGEDLTIRDLLAGEWSVQVSWNARVLFEDVLEVRREEEGGSARRRIDLPVECIDGQDEEDWLRAGKEYPLATE